MIKLKTTAKAMEAPEKTIIGQYHDITEQISESVEVQPIPDYSWNNREEPKVSVWLPLSR